MNEQLNSSTLTSLLRAKFNEITVDHLHLLKYPKLPNDLKIGAEAIGECAYGPGKARKVYNIWAQRQGTLPLMQHGAQIAARESTIKAMFWSRERAAFAEESQEDLVRLHILLTQILLLTASGLDLSTAVRDDVQVRALTMEALRIIVRLVH